MNGLYRMELMPMLLDLDAHLDQIFSHYGFYESEKLTKAEFKRQLLKDYSEMLNSPGGPVSEKNNKSH
ncbi:MAG: hypothetical protein OQK97_00725 [Deltaproteobacteria bacterium]|jgi:hypothetical protein|nr:hypothetical protein [Deltaproteobacteria bacterium]